MASVAGLRLAAAPVGAPAGGGRAETVTGAQTPRRSETGEARTT